MRVAILAMLLLLNLAFYLAHGRWWSMFAVGFVCYPIAIGIMDWWRDWRVG